MVYNKKPGVYFTETTGRVNTQQDEIPLFVVQTSTALTIDNEYTLFDSINSFKTLVDGKGLTKTTEYIEQALTEIGNTTTKFYVYSIKTDTNAAFTQVVTDSDNIPEIHEIYYIEETKSANGNAILSKCNALQLGCTNSYAKGIAKIAYVVPYGTIADAYTNAEPDKIPAVVTALRTLGEGISGNRLALINPDNYAGAVIGKIYKTPYNEDVGYAAINTGIGESTYQYTDSQELTLMNAGVLVITSELRQGIKINRILLGVTTAFSTAAADGQLTVRRIADEVLNDVKDTCDPFVKARTSEQNITFLQTDIDSIIEAAVDRGDLQEEGSELTVSQGADDYTFNVTGTLKPARAVIAIEVNTTIN